MITTHKIPYRNGELRIGWASWDKGDLTERSIKFAYPDAAGKISRGSPELPFDILIDMLMYAAEQGELKPVFDRLRAPLSPVGGAALEDLLEEEKALRASLIVLQKMTMDLPWAKVGPLYDQLGSRREEVAGEIAKRRGGSHG